MRTAPPVAHEPPQARGSYGTFYIRACWKVQYRIVFDFQAGISGSTELEDFVVVAAQAGLTGHLRVGARARIGAQAGVMADVAAAADVVGAPAQPVRDFFRQVATLKKLAARRGQGAAGAADPDPAQ